MASGGGEAHDDEVAFHAARALSVLSSQQLNHRKIVDAGADGGARVLTAMPADTDVQAEAATVIANVTSARSECSFLSVATAPSTYCCTSARRRCSSCRPPPPVRSPTSRRRSTTSRRLARRARRPAARLSVPLGVGRRQGPTNRALQTRASSDGRPPPLRRRRGAARRRGRRMRRLPRDRRRHVGAQRCRARARQLGRRRRTKKVGPSRRVVTELDERGAELGTEERAAGDARARQPRPRRRPRRPRGDGDEAARAGRSLDQLLAASWDSGVQQDGDRDLQGAHQAPPTAASSSGAAAAADRAEYLDQRRRQGRRRASGARLQLLRVATGTHDRDGLVADAARGAARRPRKSGDEGARRGLPPARGRGDDVAAERRCVRDGIRPINFFGFHQVQFNTEFRPRARRCPRGGVRRRDVVFSSRRVMPRHGPSDGGRRARRGSRSRWSCWRRTGPVDVARDASSRAARPASSRSDPIGAPSMNRPRDGEVGHSHEQWCRRLTAAGALRAAVYEHRVSVGGRSRGRDAGGAGGG